MLQVIVIVLQLIFSTPSCPVVDSTPVPYIREFEPIEL